MMKKILAVSALAMGAMLTGQAHAAATAAGPGPAPVTVTPAQCAALSNNITVQLSNKVNMAYNCSNTAAWAATCHVNGTLKQQTIPCNYSLQQDGTYLANAAGCPTYDPNAAAGSQTTTFNGRLGYRGGSGGGTVGSIELGSTTCDATSIKAKVPDSLVQ